jgi:hypothetical protein
MYYVGFCTATIVASLILFKGFNTTSATNTVSLLCGFIVTFMGVHVLNIAMLDEAEQALPPGGVALEGRLSIDGWHGIRRESFNGGRRSSYGMRTPLFGGFGGEGETGDSMALERLLEEDEDADERTAPSTNSSRRVSPRNTPSPNHTNIRISPRPV